MIRRIFLAVEQLETRALPSGISYSLTTDQSAYEVGEPIQMTFTETNTGDQAMTLGLPYNLLQFGISHQGYTIWGNLVSFSQTTVTLQPGQSYSQTVTWDGQTPSSSWDLLTGESVPMSPLGTFVISAFGDSVTKQQATFPGHRPFVPAVAFNIRRFVIVSIGFASHALHHSPAQHGGRPRSRRSIRPSRVSPPSMSRTQSGIRLGVSWPGAPDLPSPPRTSRYRSAPGFGPTRRTSRSRDRAARPSSAVKAVSRSWKTPRSEAIRPYRCPKNHRRPASPAIIKSF